MTADLRAARRQLVLDSLGIAVSAIGFALVFGLSARNAGYSLVETSAMSVFAFAGAAQFAAVGYVAQGLPWLPIVVLTFFLNARHLLYSASLAPRLRHVPWYHRAAMAHVLTDEAFALAATHFHRLGRVDVPGYWIGAVLGVFIPWNVATIAGYLLGSAIPDPAVLGLDIVFPAAMAGLAVGLMTGRREVAAACAGAAIGVGASLVVGLSVGIVLGGLVGPLVGMAVPAKAAAGPIAAESSLPLRPSHMGEAVAELDDAEHVHPLPPIPFGTYDIDEALDESEADAALDVDADAPEPPR
ncbi:MAG TPA: AzlC family ABC transporter permease [Candidatus Limnocylindrales bacterium]|jgi:4-azaleucine resistance transporter AzlC|nr:AzlC family ABC transporter permease [Candidatus Limnocylindrales bacterium]